MVATRRPAASRGRTELRLLDAGLSLFFERGYTGTTVRDITDACGLTPGALYNHFASKDELLYRIIDGFHDDADATLSAAADAVPVGGAELLERLARDFTALHIARPRETRVANRDYIHLPDVERARIVRRRRRIRSLFAQTLRDGEREGIFSFDSLGHDDAITAVSMAIIEVAISVGEWFQPRGARSAEDTAALHGRIALRIARG